MMPNIEIKAIIKKIITALIMILITFGAVLILLYDDQNVKLALIANKNEFTQENTINSTELHPPLMGFLNLLKPNNEGKGSEFSLSYPDYLLNISLVIMNFLQDKNYSAELKKIPDIDLPPKIKEILIELAEYNSVYLNRDIPDHEIIFPKNSFWLEKFIKIEKKSNIEKDKEKLKLRITEKLDFFMEFIFSEKLHKAFEV